jgi:GTP cyclohydrolase I
MDTSKNLAQVLRERMQADNKRFWAGDNISEYVKDEFDKNYLIEEATVAFEGVLDALLIDRENDPNSKGTARRLAKMYFNEIMAGRYEPAPDATAFPNDSADRYEGMLVVRSELRSMCSHHHQPVSGVAYMESLLLKNLLVLASTLALLSGVPVAVHYRKNSAMTLHEKSPKQPKATM